MKNLDFEVLTLVGHLMYVRKSFAYSVSHGLVFPLSQIVETFKSDEYVRKHIGDVLCYVDEESAEVGPIGAIVREMIVCDNGYKVTDLFEHYRESVNLRMIVWSVDNCLQYDVAVFEDVSPWYESYANLNNCDDKFSNMFDNKWPFKQVVFDRDVGV